LGYFLLLVLSTVKTLFFVLFLSSSTIIYSLYISFPTIDIRAPLIFEGFVSETREIK